MTNCDFCLAPSAPWTFRCSEFMIALPGSDVILEMVGAWAACEPCKTLICAGDPEAHVEYCMKSPQIAEEEQAAAKAIVQGFWTYREGEPYANQDHHDGKEAIEED